MEPGGVGIDTTDVDAILKISCQSQEISEFNRSQY
jgi:hypothetical protein